MVDGPEPRGERLTSLRVRLLLPILAAAVVAAVVVTGVSYALGASAVQQGMDRRFQSVMQTVAPASFPLTDAVLAMLGRLSNTHLVALAEDGSVVRSTLGGAAADRPPGLGPETARALRRWSPDAPDVVVGGRRFHVRMVARRPEGAAAAPIRRVAVLFDQRAIQRARLQAAALPLLTGLSTTLALTAVTLLLTGRLVHRLTALQQRVERIAEGDFVTTWQPLATDCQEPGDAERKGVHDEVAALGRAVDSMAADLRQLWMRVQQQERGKLLHQMAAGLAHQLRNSLTGARIALDLHAARCAHGLDEGLRVAVGELERVEAYVQRILLIASGRQYPDAPGSLASCLEDVRQSLSPVAKHLGARLEWQIAPQADQYHVADVSTLAMAVSNLVLNALQAQATRVDVSAQIQQQRLVLSVVDDGPGPPADLADRLFDPFVSSKPEGLGLGLPLVRRAAEKLGGAVSWRRQAPPAPADSSLLPRPATSPLPAAAAGAELTIFELHTQLLPDMTPAPALESTDGN